jgi:hypothetical protein
VQVLLKSVYIGILVGPDVTDEDRWMQVISKFMSRGRLLGGLRLGWQTKVAVLPRTFPKLATTISRTFHLPHNQVPAWLLMNLKALHSRSEMIDIAATSTDDEVRPEVAGLPGLSRTARGSLPGARRQ